MAYLGVFTSNKLNSLFFYFLLGLLLSLSFEPFNIPFLPLFVIGIFFLLNEYIYKKMKEEVKFFSSMVLALVLVFFYQVYIGYLTLY